MSRSSPPAHRSFGDGERASLDAVLVNASPVQRAWLAGFLAGLDAAGGQSQAAPAQAPKASEPLTVIYASESGNSEKLAGDVAKLARKQGFKPKVVDFADLDLATLPKAGKLVAIAATWGEGEPPARAVRAYGELMGEGAPRLDGVEFAVLSLGDTSYVEFCAIGKALDAGSRHSAVSALPSGPTSTSISRRPPPPNGSRAPSRRSRRLPRPTTSWRSTSPAPAATRKPSRAATPSSSRWSST